MRPGAGGEGAGKLEQAGDPAGIVERAVADPVRFALGTAKSEMVPMRGVDENLVRVARARQDGEQIVGGEMLCGGVEAGGKAHPGQRTRAEAALLGRMPLLLQIEPGAAEQPLGRVLAQIAGEADQGVVGAGNAAGRTRAAAQHLPGQACKGFVMDDDDPRRALPPCFLDLRRGAPEIAERGAAERAARLLMIGIVGEHDDDLPVHVEAGIIVPALVRRVDPVAGEDQGRARKLDMRGGVARRDDQRVGRVPGAVGAGGIEGKAAVCADPGAVHRHRLGPAAILPRRADARGAKLFGQVSERSPLALGAGPAPFEGIGSEHAHMGGQPRRIDGGRPRGRRHARGDVHEHGEERKQLFHWRSGPEMT